MKSLKKLQLLTIINNLMTQNESGITNNDVFDAIRRDYESYYDALSFSNKVTGFDMKDPKCIKAAYEGVLKKCWTDIDKEIKEAGEKFALVRIGTKNTTYQYPQGLDFNPCERALNRERKNVKSSIYEILKTSFELLPKSWITALGLPPEEDETHSMKIIMFDSTSLRNSELLPIIYEHIKHRQVIEFSYQPYHKESYQVKMTPYLLKEYNMRWYVFGRSECKGKKYDAMSHYSIDRIERNSVHAIDVEYIDNNLDYEQYFNEIVGVTFDNENELEEIELLAMNQNTLGYIQTKKIHPSQQIEGNIIKLRLRPNHEFIDRLLQYADQLKLIKGSDKLRNEMVSRAKRMIENLTS
ncbi:MAG: WYL domain-containing protein [Prevotella sp.]|nr:WYL domain-containing protein [Prevotella sp.]